MELKDIISSGLLELYVSGLSSKVESTQVEEWAVHYPEVKHELTQIEETLETYASANAIMPSAEVKDKIFARLQKHSYNNSSASVFSDRVNPVQTGIGQAQGMVRKISSWYQYAAAASIILLVISAVLAFNYYTKYNDANQKLQVAEQKLQHETEMAQAMNSDLNVMGNKYAKPVVLNGTPHAPQALAKIYWMTNSGDVWVDPANLPEIPSGKQYQLWAIVDGKPIDAGMISNSKGMYHVQKMKTFGKAEAFAITMEASGGSPTPKGDMVVIAKI